MAKKTFFLLTCIFVLSFAYSQSISSTSTVDWSTQSFNSELMLDIEAAGINMPSGRNAAIVKINTNLPALEKDPFLSLYADSAYSIGDFVLQNQITFEDISTVMSQGKKKPGILSSDMGTMTVNHSFY